MKNKFKKAVALATVIAVSVSVGVIGTVAYLMSQDGQVNVMTVGKVTIEQNEQQRAENGGLEAFEQDKKAVPSTAEDTDKTGFDWNGDNTADYQLYPTSKNVVDKMVSVENTGDFDAYVRTIIAVEIGTDASKPIPYGTVEDSKYWYKTTYGEKVSYGGTYYEVFVFTPNIDANNKDVVLAAGATTPPSLLQAYIASDATNEDIGRIGEKWNIIALSQAVQADGFDSAAEAFKAAFGEVDKANLTAWLNGVPTTTPTPTPTP